MIYCMVLALAAAISIVVLTYVDVLPAKDFYYND